MTAPKKKARNPLQREPGRSTRIRRNESDGRIATTTARRHKKTDTYDVWNGDEPPFTLPLQGRLRWALDRLRQAGPRGVTPIEEPGPRWSAYVFDLRALGVDIETVHEAHGGDYPGTHGRYVLRSAVTRREGGAA